MKVKMLLQIAGAYQQFDPESGIKTAEEAIVLARRIGNPFLLAEACNKKGANLTGIGMIEEAIPCFEEASQLFETARAPRRVAAMLSNIGAMYNYKRDYANALKHFEMALKSQEAIGDKEGIARTLGNLGLAATTMGDYPKALDYLDKAAVAYQRLNNTAALGNVYNNTGNTYNYLADYPKALEFYQKALTIYQKTGQKIDEAEIVNNIGTVYYYLGDYTKSLEYQQKALAIFETSGNKESIAQSHINMSSRYKGLKNYPAALESAQKALALLQEINKPSSLAYCYSNFSGLYYDLKDYAQALEFAQKSLEINTQLEDYFAIATGHKKLCDIYFFASDSVLIQAGIQPEQRLMAIAEQYTKALDLAKEIEASNLLSELWYNASIRYEKAGDYRNAFDAFSQYVELNDSILGEDTKKQITRKEIQFEFDKKESILKLEQQLTLEQLEQQKLLSFQQQQALLINQQSLALSNKEKDLQRLAYLKEKAEKQEKEQALSLAEIDKQLQDVQLGALLQDKALQLKTLAEKNALIGFLVAGISAVLLAFAAFYFWIRQRQAKKVAATQAQFTRQLLEHVEDDRGRIAIDLHDSVSHDLLLLKQSIRKEITGPEVEDKIDEVINGIRQISRNLHPVMLDKIGLRLSLETLCEQFMQHETMYVSHEIEYQNTLPKSAELQLFRIVQEGLTNAMKYSKAEAVKVHLKSSGNVLRLEIQDNGKGFEVEKALEGGKAFGLHSILQRAKAIGGKAEIRSGEGGTMIGVVIG